MKHNLGFRKHTADNVSPVSMLTRPRLILPHSSCHERRHVGGHHCQDRPGEEGQLGEAHLETPAGGLLADHRRRSGCRQCLCKFFKGGPCLTYDQEVMGSIPSFAQFFS